MTENKIEWDFIRIKNGQIIKERESDAIKAKLHSDDLIYC